MYLWGSKIFPSQKKDWCHSVALVKIERVDRRERYASMPRSFCLEHWTDMTPRQTMEKPRRFGPTALWSRSLLYQNFKLCDLRWHEIPKQRRGATSQASALATTCHGNLYILSVEIFGVVAKAAWDFVTGTKWNFQHVQMSPPITRIDSCGISAVDNNAYRHAGIIAVHLPENHPMFASRMDRMALICQCHTCLTEMFGSKKWALSVTLKR